MTARLTNACWNSFSLLRFLENKKRTEYKNTELIPIQKRTTVQYDLSNLYCWKKDFRKQSIFTWSIWLNTLTQDNKLNLDVLFYVYIIRNAFARNIKYFRKIYIFFEIERVGQYYITSKYKLITNGKLNFEIYLY